MTAFRVYLDWLNRYLLGWLGAKSWRWRAAHGVLAVGIEIIAWRLGIPAGFAVGIYAGRELVLWVIGKDRKPAGWHVLDCVPPLVVSMVAATWRAP